MTMVERIDSKIRMESKIDQSHLNSRKETKRNKDKRKEGRIAGSMQTTMPFS